MLLLLALSRLAHADDMDFEHAAKARMKLSFDNDEVQAELAAPAAAAPRSPMLQGRPALPRAALPLEPNSTLDHVVVLRDRAIVTRTRELKLAAGSQRVRFDGLPLGLAADALHARVRDGSARVVGVELVSGTGDVEETERIEKVRAEAKTLSDQLGAVQDHIESLLMQRAYLRGAVLPGTGPDGGSVSRPLPTLDIVKGTLGWVGDAERDLAAKLRADEERAKELGEDLEPLLVKLRDPLATGMTVRVDLDVASASTVDLALGYTVAGAGWTPSYNARLDPETNTVTLETNALVAQTTGESWTNATLQLSTADPVVGGAAPVLEAWVLDEGGVDASQFGDAGGVRTGAGAMMLDVQGRRTIAGDGSESRLPLTSGTFPTVVSLTTVPQKVPAVFRSAHVTWTGESPLLPGPVASFVGADYVGSAALLAVAPGEAMDLGFGVDERLKVDRQLVDRQVENLLGARTRYTVRYKTTVQNFGKAPRTVVLTDQLPVSQIEKVSVVLLDSTPSVPDPAAPPGVLRWPLTIPPGGIATVELSFTVTAPRELAYRIDQMMY
ncbi:MAG: mucoidy inhibitor MuiA family protein [Pseudomonadota bacterium]|nr:mucoidy inhibitor MuiA family protein [Pseudomonadota bacterium]